MCWTTFIFIASLFALVNSSCFKNSTRCENVLIEKFGEKKLNNQQIQVISRCPANYANPEIKPKCENITSEGAITEDIFLFTLVQGKSCPYFPYYNIYCAICWNEVKINNFPPHLKFTHGYENGTNKIINLESERLLLILRNLTLNQTSNELMSNDGEIKYFFKVARSLKVHNNSKNEFPVESVFDYSEIMSCPTSSSLSHDDSAFQKISSKDKKSCNSSETDAKNLIDLFKEIKNLRENETWTPNQTFFPKTSLPKFNSCKYANSEGNHCSHNGFLVKGVDFTFGGNGDIFLMENETKYDRGQYTNETDIENVIFLCQPKIVSTDQQCIKIMDSVTAWSRRVSLFFVILYLIINCNRKYLSNLADKFTYSYYLTLLAMYIREEISEWRSDEEPGCFLEYYARIYLSQSYSIWICICSFYVWYLVRFSKEEITAKSINTKRQMVIYLIMCLFGWITPAIFSLLFYSLEHMKWMKESNASCPVIQGYNRLKICQRQDNTCPYYWFTLVIVVTSSVTVVVLFVNACYYYYFAKSIYNRYCKFGKLRVRMVFLFKIVYSIGLYSMLAMNSILDLSEGVYVILTHLWSIHGTVIFFVYGFKMTVLKQMFKDKEAVCESCSCKVPARRKNNLIPAHLSAVQRNLENE